MKKPFTGLIMCFSMFSVLPMPAGVWDDSLRRSMLRCFPLLGAVLGAIYALIIWGLRAILPGSMLAAAIIAALPVLLSGAIHLDGYMDVADAVLSRRSREERLKILKDPHCGAFAVTAAAMLFIFMLAGAYEAFSSPAAIVSFAFIPAVSRACALIAVSTVKPLEHSQYSAPKKSGADAVCGLIWLLAILCGAAAYAAYAPTLLAGFGALIACGATIFGYCAALLWAGRSLGGISGDVSGFALTVGEAAGLISLGIIGGIL